MKQAKSYFTIFNSPLRLASCRGRNTHMGQHTAPHSVDIIPKTETVKCKVFRTIGDVSDDNTPPASVGIQTTAREREPFLSVGKLFRVIVSMHKSLHHHHQN